MSVLDIRVSGGTTLAGRSYRVVHLEGFIDAPNHSKFDRALEKLPAEDHVVLDFGGVEYVNSTGISSLIRLHGRLDGVAKVSLIRVSRSVGLTMHLLGLTTLTPFFQKIEEAEEYIDADEDDTEQLATGRTISQFQDDVSSDVTSTGTVVLAVPRTGDFERIYRKRVKGTKKQYHLVHSCAGVIESAARWNPDVIVVDSRLDGSDALVQSLKVEEGFSLASIISLYESEKDLERFDKFRVWENDYLCDPFEISKLFDLTDSELDRVPNDRRLFSQQVRFEFASEREYVDRGLKLVDELVGSLALDDEQETSALYAAVKESIENSVLHGNKFDPMRKVNVTFVVNPNKVTFLVEDEGEGFDFDYYLNQIDGHEAFDRAKDRIRAGGRGGLGILLMQRCSDRLEYTGNGNIVRIEKNL